MNIVESLKGIIRHTSRTQHPLKKFAGSADDFDDKWGTVIQISSWLSLKVGWAIEGIIFELETNWKVNLNI